MQYGYIVLANTKKGFIPNAIKWFTNSEFSHSLVILPNILNIPMGIEASGSGVDAVRFDTQYRDNTNQAYEIWEINCAETRVDSSITLLLNDLELSYGYLQYPWFIWRKINKFFGRDIKNQDNWNKSGMICSQLCVTHLTQLDLDHVLVGYGKGSIAPQDLKSIFLAYPNIFKLKEKKE